MAWWFGGSWDGEICQTGIISAKMFNELLLSLLYYRDRIRCHAMGSVEKTLSFFHPIEHPVTITSWAEKNKIRLSRDISKSNKDRILHEQMRSIDRNNPNMD